MCVGGTPDVPTQPERQAAKPPTGDIRARLSDSDARRRGYAAAMVSTQTSTPGTTNILGV
jgi:hypothetical protein